MTRLDEAVRATRSAIVALADAGVPNEHISSLSITLDRGAEAARKRSHLHVIRGTAQPERPSERFVDEPEAG